MIGKGLTLGVWSPGTVGKRIIHALLRHKTFFGIKEFIVFKHRPDIEYRSVMRMMQHEGAIFAFEREKRAEFTKMGIESRYEREEALGLLDILIDCSADGIPLEHKADYARLAPQCKVFVCQGAEKDRGFGKGLLVYGVNDDVFDFERDRWIQIGSCNTHSGSFLLRAIAFPKNENGETVETGFSEADFYFIRRSLDLNQKSKSVISTEVSRAPSPCYGTHHAEDIATVFRLKGIELEGKILSSAVKINEPYFHTVHFAFTFNRPVTKDEVTRRLRSEHRILMTTRTLVHYTFQFGTEYSFMGRFSHPVIAVDWDVFRLSGNRFQVRGHAFTPQDGNFLLSNLAVVVGNRYPRSEFAKKMVGLERIFLCPLREI